MCQPGLKNTLLASSSESTSSYLDISLSCGGGEHLQVILLDKWKYMDNTMCCKGVWGICQVYKLGAVVPPKKKVVLDKVFQNRCSRIWMIWIYGATQNQSKKCMLVKVFQKCCNLKFPFQICTFHCGSVRFSHFLTLTHHSTDITLLSYRSLLSLHACAALLIYELDFVFIFVLTPHNLLYFNKTS